LIAALTNEPARPQVEALLRGRPASSISAANLAEVADWLARIGGRPQDAVRDRIDWLIVGGLAVEPVWVPVARLGASLRAQHYHRTDMPLSLADCFCLATAITLETGLATTDPHLAQIGRDLGVEIIALPDSTGRRP
jgi:PIN domain nuclease of toxin-antitoxin system